MLILIRIHSCYGFVIHRHEFPHMIPVCKPWSMLAHDQTGARYSILRFKSGIFRRSLHGNLEGSLCFMVIWLDVVKNEQYKFEIGQMHKKYSPIVHINPFELHVETSGFCKKLYASGGKKHDR